MCHEVSCKPNASVRDVECVVLPQTFGHSAAECSWGLKARGAVLRPRCFIVVDVDVGEKVWTCFVSHSRRSVVHACAHLVLASSHTSRALLHTWRFSRRFQSTHPVCCFVFFSLFRFAHVVRRLMFRDVHTLHQYYTVFLMMSFVDLRPSSVEAPPSTPPPPFALELIFSARACRDQSTRCLA